MSKVVLGGGLSGLSAAYYHLRRYPNEKLTLLESSNRTGGWVNTIKTNSGILFESGPRTIRPKGPAARNTLELIEDLDLEDDVLPITANHPSATNRMIYVNGELCKLPSSLSSLFFKSSPFSKPIILYLCKDLWTPSKKSSINDESIYDFVNRRFGDEIADYLISPMICGICAGNAKEISVKFLMESLFNYEQTHGSISRGLLKSLFQKKDKLLGYASGKFIERVSKENWSLYSFKNGMDTLPKKLTTFIESNGTEFLLNTNCKAIEFQNDIALLHTDEKSFETKHIFACIPAQKLANLFEVQHPQLSSLLKTITMVDVAVINLHFNENFILQPAFGYLIPPKEEIPVLGVIFDSCYRNQSDSTILTVMMGGWWYEKYLGKNISDNQLFELALNHVKCTMNINIEPIEFKVNILRDCIPQYTIGHKTRVKQINDYIKENKLPISLCGASYYGVGVNDVILSARNAIDNI